MGCDTGGSASTSTARARASDACRSCTCRMDNPVEHCMSWVCDDVSELIIVLGIIRDQSRASEHIYLPVITQAW